MNIERETIDFDVLFVGGGPTNLAGAIKLMQIAKQKSMNLEVAIIEKGADIGANALSGAVLNPVALKELIPDFMERECPIESIVRDDEFYFLTKNACRHIPFTSKYMRNKGFYIISLSKFTKWLANIAEELGVNIFPSFAGKKVLYAHDQKTIIGVRTGDKGLGHDGQPKGNFELGIDLMAKITVFGEGAKGSLTQDVAEKLDVFSGKMPQIFEIGFKEVIQATAKNNYFATSKGNDIHLFGYPLGLKVPGGGFIYEMKNNKIAIGFLIGLSYQNSMMDIYEEFIKFKRHPFVASIINGGKVIEQGARTVPVGGYFTMPKLAIDGAMFAGGCASMQNTPALKGIHISMKSGMLAAEAAIRAFEQGNFKQKTLMYYDKLVENSWIKKEMYQGRNFSQALAKKSIVKFIHLGAQYISQGRGIQDNMPIKHQDCETLKPARKNSRGGTSKKNIFDGVLYVDKLTGVYLSKTMHREDQPSHIIIYDENLCVNECYTKYRCPCTRFCPGNVYELETTPQIKLKLNPSNCLHCKTCIIKDPYQNITWTCPEGGDGPGYTIV